MLTLPFQILTCSFVLMRTKLMQKLNRNLAEEENSSQRLKILKRRSQLKTRMNWQKERFSQKQLTRKSFDNDNKLTLKSFFNFSNVFFYKDKRRKDGKEFQTDTVSGFQNTPALHQRAKTCSALSFYGINFFTDMANLFFTFSESLCYVLLFSCANKNFLF